MELQSCAKRKERKSSSEESFSPENKRLRDGEEELCRQEAHEASAIVECVQCEGSDNSTLPGLQAMGKEQVDTDKMDKVLSKLEKLEFIASEIQTLRSTVDKINLTVPGLQKDFSRVEKDLKSVTTETGELKTSVVNLNKDVEDGKANLEKSNKKHEEDLNKLRLQLLNYEVYQRRENLRFYGIREEVAEEDTKETLYSFMENQLKMSNARSIELQRVHRVGKRGFTQAKPRAIIARFLRYTDREAIFSRRSCLDGESGLGIGPDLPREVIDRRKILIPKMLEARKQGKRAAFSRAEPYKLFIDGEQFT